MVEAIRQLYEEDGWGARVFRGVLFVFDVITIAYFLWTATAEMDATILAIDIVIGLVLLADLAARMAIAERRIAFLVSLPTLADIVVLISLALPLVAGSNFGFLRVMRVLRLLRSFRLIEQLSKYSRRLDINPQVVEAGANLVAFIFVVTSIVWVWEHDRSESMQTYVDALYFTITTLTTTGYGDITLTDRVGRLLTIAIMVFGVGFFLKLLQALYRPDKVEQRCEDCGLDRHDRDATHCKHCGETIYIETDGET